MTPLQELQGVFHKLPFSVMEDINQRVTDWVVSGGKEDAPYIKQQLKYAKKVIDLKEQIQI